MSHHTMTVENRQANLLRSQFSGVYSKNSTLSGENTEDRAGDEASERSLDERRPRFWRIRKWVRKKWKQVRRFIDRRILRKITAIEEENDSDLYSEKKRITGNTGSDSNAIAPSQRIPDTSDSPATTTTTTTTSTTTTTTTKAKTPDKTPDKKDLTSPEKGATSAPKAETMTTDTGSDTKSSEMKEEEEEMTVSGEGGGEEDEDAREVEGDIIDFDQAGRGGDGKSGQQNQSEAAEATQAEGKAADGTGNTDSIAQEIEQAVNLEKERTGEEGESTEQQGGENVTGDTAGEKRADAEAQREGDDKHGAGDGEKGREEEDGDRDDETAASQMPPTPISPPTTSGSMKENEAGEASRKELQMEEEDRRTTSKQRQPVVTEPPTKAGRRISCAKICTGASQQYYDPKSNRSPEIQCHCPAGEPKNPVVSWDTTYVRMLIQVSDDRRGEVVVEVHDSWAPYASGRFLQLANTGFFAGNKFFKVEDNFVAHFGINGDPTVSDAWSMRVIPEDPVRESNRRGYLSFAPDPRPQFGQMTTTEVFINLVDNSHLDKEGFAPFGRIVEGMETVDSLFVNCFPNSDPHSLPDPLRIYTEGNRYLETLFPELSFIIGTRVEKNYEKRPSAQ
eukprot:CAMPEP_0184501978 /NCGR_PEP_ID=MMETSP0113_2-20130426/49092_1 /TAXON_ID=91329 /ORGANISM="Norrisiella sphaerica, Strain BC52" /LENGTH=619 /DNA_ID=CAMNT_0026890939 /DNA_START=139 /DNA_END=1998 /DNA_ORIENTATION=+